MSWCFMAMMSLTALTMTAQDVVIRRSTTTTTTTTTSTTRVSKPQDRVVKPPKPKVTTGTLSITSTPSASMQTFTAGGVTFKMVRVEGGTFTMGATSEQGSDADSDESPAHRVTLPTYYIGETEVTQALWQAVMGNNPSHFKGYNLPVEQVSWEDCQNFIRKLNSMTKQNFRLPTEAEWEFAARGGNKSQGCKYSGNHAIDKVAWYTNNSGSKTHPVKTKTANELGVYDMSGNVWEWCQDWYGRFSPQTNPKGPSSGSYRVFRGGSWNYFAKYCRVSIRSNSTPDYRYYNLGFRLAL